MAEIATSIVANTTGNLATEYTSPYVRYFFHFGKIVEEFKNWRNQLELKQDRVKNDVDEAMRQTEEIEKDVQDWLTTAEKELGEAQNLEDEIERNKCFKWCPNWGWRYCLSKKVAKKTLLIFKLLESSNFSRVGHRVPLEGIEFLISNDYFMPSESSKVAFNGIMKALTSDGVNMIGLYGMPGVGKTTLAKEVGKKAREKKLFDKVVIVTVSQTPDFNKIQNEIAEILGLKFETTVEKTRAEELWRRLKGENKVLIIFDDIWKCYFDDDDWDQLKMKYIGIPFGDEHQGCKILLTTRFEQVCTQMNCQEKIQLNLLSKAEAWNLFKYNANLENASHMLIDVAKEVASECKGLPLAIITIGRALKNRTLNEWEVVNQRLKDCRHLENQDVCEGIYRSLKISYDYLKVDNCRSCLLLCSLFPEDYEIEIDELTIYGIGQGMFDEVHTVENARKEMGAKTTKLQESGLLLETDKVGTVKMHDVVRDFVHWMTSKGENDQNMFYVRSGIKKWPRQRFGCYTAISLIMSELNNFPDRVEFPKLEVFLLDVKRNTRVPSTFFQGMKALKVLFLRGAILSLEGLQFLPNLRILRLEWCDLENASWLGNLKKLEILIIHRSEIKELWQELTGLTTLRLLAISCYYSSRVFILPTYWLSSLVELEELYLELDVEWAISEESTNKVSLSELSSLPRLTQLSMQVVSEYIPKQFVFPPLQSYHIIVNNTRARRMFARYKNRRCLEIWKFSLNAFKELFCNVEDLELRDILDLEYLIDTTKDQGSKSAFTILVRLTLSNLICLKGLCHGRPPVGFLQKLKTLTIEHCSNLVLEVAMVQNLKELMAKQCKQLQVIFQTDGVLLHANQEIQMPLESSLTTLFLASLPELRSIWTGPTDHVSLANLKVVRISNCNKLTSVFTLSLAQTLLHLKHLEISHCNGLEQVFGNMAEETDNGQDIWLPQLQSLVFKDLQNLSNICLRNYFVVLSSVKNFQVLNCPKLAQSKDFRCAYKDMISCSKNLTLDGTNGFRNLIPNVDQEGQNGFVFLKLHNCGSVEYLYDTTDHRQPTIAFSNLVELVIEEMIGLKKLCNNRPPNGFLQKLEKLKIKNCLNLASLSLMGQNLKEARIESCGQLREIFQVDEVLHNMEANQAPLVSNLTCLELHQLSELRCIWKGSTHYVSLRNLKVVRISSCNKLASVFSVSLAQTLLHLERLEISHCNGLEQVFGNMAEEIDNGQDIQLPQLQSLVLEDLQNLSSICLRNCFVMLPSLKNFQVLNCPKLAQSKDFRCAYKDMISCSKNLTLDGTSWCRNLIPDVDRKGQNGFVFLKLHNCGNVEYLYETTDHRQSTIAFSNLVELVVEGMIGLKKLCNNQPPNGFLQKLEKLKIKNCMNLASLSLVRQNLKEVRIESCGQLQEIFQVDEVLHNMEANQAPLMSNLTCLELHQLSELRFIWKGSTYHVSLRNIKVIRISSCNKLTSVFSASLAQTLLHLERLEISHCNRLEQVFNNMAEETNTRQDIRLPQLQSLILEDLQNLSSICLRNYFVVLPSLENFLVVNCLKLTQSEDFLCACKDMIPCSKKLTLDRTSGCRNLIPDVDREGLNGLVFLKLHNCSDVECLYETTDHRQPTIAFSNLMELVIEEMIGLKKLCNNRPPNGFLQKLEKLNIKNCMNLASLSPVGQNLKFVMLESCDKLREIFQMNEVLHNMETNQAPVPMSNLISLELKQLIELRCIWKMYSQSVINLQSLMFVRISNCNRLRCLFSPFLVKTLVQLKLLILRDLPELEQLSTEQESDAEKEQQVLKMAEEKVAAQYKPFLPLMLPSLEIFEVSRCPRLTPFVIQQEVNNQAQVKGLYLSNQQCNSYDILLRQSLPNLEHGIVGNHLQFLQRLIMSNCSKLKYLFSPMLAQSLPHLSYLYIVQCKELEQIIDKDKTSASSSQGHLQPICFSSLNEIHIEECNNLKCLFSVSVALSLSQLQWFTIRGASKLEQIFDYQDGTGIEDIEKEIVLPHLRSLSLEVLPRLKSFIPMGYHCSFPCLISLIVEQCPNLATSFNTDSKHTMHARTKQVKVEFVMQAAGDWPMEASTSDVDVMEGSDTNGEAVRPVGSDINWKRRSGWM